MARLYFSIIRLLLQFLFSASSREWEYLWIFTNLFCRLSFSRGYQLIIRHIGIQRDPSFDLDVITMQSTLSARSVATLAVLIPLSGSIMETTLSILFSLPRGSWQRHTAFATPSLYNNGYLLALNQMR